MSSFVKKMDSFCRWSFVVLTWAICVIFVYDFWNLFREFSLSLFLNSSLTVLIAVLALVFIGFLAYKRKIKTLRFLVCVLFFVSIACLYSYVGVRFSERVGKIFGNYRNVEIRQSDPGPR